MLDALVLDVSHIPRVQEKVYPDSILIYIYVIYCMSHNINIFIYNIYYVNTYLYIA